VSLNSIRAAEDGDDLAGERLGPDDANRFGEIAPDQRAHIGEHRVRAGAYHLKTELPVNDVHAKGGLLDELGERILVAAQLVLGPPLPADVSEV
jgi:hypothetical protein